MILVLQSNAGTDSMMSLIEGTALTQGFRIERNCDSVIAMNDPVKEFERSNFIEKPVNWNNFLEVLVALQNNKILMERLDRLTRSRKLVENLFTGKFNDSEAATVLVEDIKEEVADSLALLFTDMLVHQKERSFYTMWFDHNFKMLQKRIDQLFAKNQANAECIQDIQNITNKKNTEYNYCNQLAVAEFAFKEINNCNFINPFAVEIDSIERCVSESPFESIVTKCLGDDRKDRLLRSLNDNLMIHVFDNTGYIMCYRKAFRTVIDYEFNLLWRCDTFED